MTTRRYDHNLPLEAEAALLEAGAWPLLETVQDKTTDGSLESEFTWFVPFKDYGLVPFRHYRSGLDVELIAANNHYYKTLEERDESWNNPRDHTPPPGWSWFGVDWILKWRKGGARVPTFSREV